MKRIYFILMFDIILLSCNNSNLSNELKNNSPDQDAKLKADIYCILQYGGPDVNTSEAVQAEQRLIYEFLGAEMDSLEVLLDKKYEELPVEKNNIKLAFQSLIKNCDLNNFKEKQEALLKKLNYTERKNAFLKAKELQAKKWEKERRKKEIQDSIAAWHKAMDDSISDANRME